MCNLETCFILQGANAMNFNSFDKTLLYPASGLYNFSPKRVYFLDLRKW